MIHSIIQSIIYFVQDFFDRFRDRARRINVAKIVRVFAREKELVTDYFSNGIVCDHPGRCAVGALLFATGLRETEDLDGRGTCTGTEFQILEDEYGLSRNEVSDIISANDAVYEQAIYDVALSSVIVGHKVAGLHHDTCSDLPINEARVCEVQAFVRTLEPA